MNVITVQQELTRTSIYLQKGKRSSIKRSEK